MLKQYWSKKAAALTPYAAGEQPRQKMIKLNTNENAYPPSPKVAPAIAEAAVNLRLYPRPNADELRQAAAEYLGISANQIFCANGSDEALAFCFLAFFDPGMPVKTMDVTYSFYPVWAELHGITLLSVPLRADLTADVDGLCGGENVVIANPNAPTGIALGLDDLEKIAVGTKGVVIVDEAYVGFGAQSAVELLSVCKNLVVVRTLSKSHSLAGLRVGYAAADEGLIAALTTVKDSFNSYPVDMLAEAGGAAALRDRVYYDAIGKKIVETRTHTVVGLASMGMRVLPSAANFIFVETPSAADVFAALRERGILVRYFPGRRTDDYLRVTIGTEEEMNVFLAAMEEIVR